MNSSGSSNGWFKNLFIVLFCETEPVQKTVVSRRVTGVVDRVGVSDACEYYAGYVLLLERSVTPFRFIADRTTHALHNQLGLVKAGDLVSFDVIDDGLTGSNFVNETLKARQV